MKLHTVEQLQQALNDDLGQRKRELSTLYLEVGKARDHLRTSLVRSAHLLLYAHFEGFTRFASTCYLEHIAAQGRPGSAHRPNFVAAMLKSRLLQVATVSRATQLTDILKAFEAATTGSALFEWKGEVDTRANLNDEVFLEILHLLGLDETPYRKDLRLIREDLVAPRNEIAHGRLRRIEVSDFREVYESVKHLLENLKTDIENAAIGAAYLRK